jgi:thymidylate synthase
MNKLDLDYQNLLKDILENGVKKETRNGGTISVFGRQVRHDMKDGFPLLTTKKMPFKTIVTELLWFLRGDTNIKYLVDNNCHIWDGDAFKNFMTKSEGDPDIIWNQEQFINKLKTDDKFAKKWGELGKIYGFQWRNWGGWKDIKQTGFLHKTDNGWTVKWSDLHSFVNGTEWLTTPIQDSDQSLYSDEDEGKKVYYKNITLGYNEKSFCPIQVAKVIDDKFDKYVGGIDQIQNLINDLKTNPDSRRLQVNAWAVHDLPNMVLPPCHYGFQVYTRELSTKEMCELAGVDYDEATQWTYHGKNIDRDLEVRNMLSDKDVKNIPTRAISLMWNQRSVDTFLGLPFNIASYGLLLEIIAKQVNMVPEELIGNLGDVHLYSNHLDAAKEQIGRELTHDERITIYSELGLTESIESRNKRFINKEKFEPNIPTRTREPFPLPTFDCPAIDEIPHTTFDELVFKLQPEDFYMDDYQSHPTIKAPLSN